MGKVMRHTLGASLDRKSGSAGMPRWERSCGIRSAPVFDGMNIISNDGSNKLNRSRKARVSYKVQRTINASLNAATSTRAVSSNPNFVTRQKIEIIFG